MSVENDLKACRAKVPELDNNIQGVGNLLDNLKSECEKNKTEMAEIRSKFDSPNIPVFDKDKCDCS